MSANVIKHSLGYSWLSYRFTDKRWMGFNLSLSENQSATFGREKWSQYDKWIPKKLQFLEWLQKRVKYPTWQQK